MCTRGERVWLALSASDIAHTALSYAADDDDVDDGDDDDQLVARKAYETILQVARKVHTESKCMARTRNKRGSRSLNARVKKKCSKRVMM